MPNYNEALDTLNTFGSKLQSEPNLDLDKEIATLKEQLQSIFDQSS